MTILLRQKPLPQVVRQIVQRDNGAWFDPEDMSTMFQDAAGTTPVTAVEQPVGLMLDKSGNGNHATQSITASRPTLSARYNLLTKTEDFTDAVWSKTAITASATTLTLSGVDIYAKKITETTANSSHLLGCSVAVSANTVHCGEIYIKSAGRTKIIFRYGKSGTPFTRIGILVDLTNGTIAQSDVGAPNSVLSRAIEQLGDGVFRISISGIFDVTSTDGRFQIDLLNSEGLSSYAGDGVSGIYVWGPTLKVGTTSGPYQRVNTATDYDSVGFPKYIKAEGVDDHFVLPYLGLYNNASCSIIASHSSSSQAANGVIVSEASSTDADTKYLPYRQLASAGNVDSYIAADNAAVILDSTGAAYSGTKENIIESIIDSGTSIETYRSGVLLSNEPYTRSATLTLNNTTLFGSVSTTNTNFLNTKLYGLIITKSNLSARDRSLCETYLKSKVQVLQV